MPDGINSIDDMKVAITAETEKLQGGLANALGIIAQFSSTGSASLGTFDASLANVGRSVDALKMKIAPWLVALEAALGVVDQMYGKAKEMAEKFGLTAELEQLQAATTKVRDEADRLNCTESLCHRRLSPRISDPSHSSGGRRRWTGSSRTRAPSDSRLIWTSLQA